MIIIQVRNPEDGVVTYDKVRIYRAAGKTDTYALIATITIDTSGLTDDFPGYTQHIDSAGTESNWYKVSFYNSSSLVETDLSDPFQGGTNELDSMIRIRLKDTNSNSYYFTNDEVAQARDIAIESLYPATWIDTTYDVLITDTNKKVVSLPQNIVRPDRIKIYDSSDSYCGDYIAFYKVGNKIYALDEFPVGYTFRIIVTKPYSIAAEVPLHYYPYLVDIAQIELLKIMENDRARFYKYTTSIRPEGGNMPSLSRQIDRLEKMAILKKNEIRRVRETTEINLVG